MQAFSSLSLHHHYMSTHLFFLGFLRLDALWHSGQPVQEDCTGNVEDDVWPDQAPVSPPLVVKGQSGRQEGVGVI